MARRICVVLQRLLLLSGIVVIAARKSYRDKHPWVLVPRWLPDIQPAPCCFAASPTATIMSTHRCNADNDPEASRPAGDAHLFAAMARRAMTSALARPPAELTPLPTDRAAIAPGAARHALRGQLQRGRVALSITVDGLSPADPLSRSRHPLTGSWVTDNDHCNPCAFGCCGGRIPMEASSPERLSSTQ